MAKGLGVLGCDMPDRMVVEAVVRAAAAVRPAPVRTELYVAWAGKELPTEAELEYAARGGLDGPSSPGATN